MVVDCELMDDLCVQRSSDPTEEPFERCMGRLADPYEQEAGPMRAAGDGLVAPGARPLPPVAGGATMLPGPENECGGCCLCAACRRHVCEG